MEHQDLNHPLLNESINKYEDQYRSKNFSLSTCYIDEHGVIYSDDKKILLQYSGDIELESYEVLHGCEIIADQAFFLKEFGSCLDAYCIPYKLVNIILPSSILYIGKHAFEGCKNLKEINLPDNILFIDDYAFANCYNLNEFLLPQSLKELGHDALPPNANIYSKSDDFIPYKDILYTKNGIVKWIKGGVHEIELPENIVGGDINVFAKANIKKINSLSSEIICLNDCAHTKSGTLLWVNKNITSFDFPESINKIDKNVFTECKKLTSLRIPPTLKRLYFSLYGCTSLKSIYIHNDVTYINSEFFVINHRYIQMDTKWPVSRYYYVERIYIAKGFLKEFEEAFIRKEWTPKIYDDSVIQINDPQLFVKKIHSNPTNYINDNNISISLGKITKDFIQCFNNHFSPIEHHNYSFLFDECLSHIWPVNGMTLDFLNIRNQHPKSDFDNFYDPNIIKNYKLYFYYTDLSKFKLIEVPNHQLIQSIQRNAYPQTCNISVPQKTSFLKKMFGLKNYKQYKYSFSYIEGMKIISHVDRDIADYIVPDIWDNLIVANNPYSIWEAVLLNEARFLLSESCDKEHKDIISDLEDLDLLINKYSVNCPTLQTIIKENSNSYQYLPRVSISSDSNAKASYHYWQCKRGLIHCTQIIRVSKNKRVQFGKKQESIIVNDN